MFPVSLFHRPDPLVTRLCGGGCTVATHSACANLLLLLAHASSVAVALDLVVRVPPPAPPVALLTVVVAVPHSIMVPRKPRPSVEGVDQRQDARLALAPVGQPTVCATAPGPNVERGERERDDWRGPTLRAGGEERETDRGGGRERERDAAHTGRGAAARCGAGPLTGMTAF